MSVSASAPGAQAAFGGVSWLPLTAMFAIQSLASMAVRTVPVGAPVIATALAVPTTVMAVFVSIVYVGAMLASLSAGPAVARFGAIRVSQWHCCPALRDWRSPPLPGCPRWPSAHC